MCTSSDTRLKLPGVGPLFKSDSNNTGSLFESPPTPLLKSGLQPLGRYGTHQETISRRPAQMYTPLTQNWNGLGRDHYSRRTQKTLEG